MKNLNERQKSILNYIVAFKEKNQYSPSVREIASSLKIKSTSTVYGDLNKLESYGFIRRISNLSRSIEIDEKHLENFFRSSRETSNQKTLEIPVLGRVAAGAPIFAEQNIEDTFFVPSHYANKGDLFMLRLKGESMIEAGMFDGDLVLVRKQNTCENGDIIVALIEDGATVKRFKKTDKEILLMPENKQMQPIKADYFEILGKVVALYRDHI